MDAFPLILPETYSSRLEVLTQLEEWYKAAPKIATLIKNMKGARLSITNEYVEFKKGQQSSSTSDMDSAQHLTSTTTRPEPEGFSDPSFDSVYLVHPLQVGTNRTSQVWLASFYPGTTADEANLVVKIYQASFHSAMHAGTIRRNVKRAKAWKMFHEFKSEAQAYQAYAALQGSYVPHVRGFYVVTLPHGEPSVVMVMERIRKVQPSPATIELGRAFNGLFETAHALYKCGFVSSDFNPRNVLWPATADGRCASLPVFIDFGRMYGKLERLEVKLMAMECIRMLRQYTFPRDRVIAWATSAITPTSTIGSRFSLTAEEVELILEDGASDTYKPEAEHSKSPDYDGPLEDIEEGEPTFDEDDD